MRGKTSQGPQSRQDFVPKEGDVKQLATVMGTDLIGAALKAPLSVYSTVYCLPMMTVSDAKVGCQRRSRRS